MAAYNYVVEYNHGSAEGTVQADSAKEAKEKAKALYDGLARDVTVDGKPGIETTKVSKVTVTEVKEA